MKSHKYDFQTERQQRMTILLTLITQPIRWALAMVGLTIGLIFPGHFGILQAANQTTTPTATNPGWVQTGAMNTARYGHTATLLENGKVLVSGGAVGPFCLSYLPPHPNNITTSSAELYDPATATWSNTDSLNVARMKHTATLLKNGQVLIAGGYTVVFDQLALNSAEVFDPDTGQWRFTGNFQTIERLFATTLLTDGKVLAVGFGNSEFRAELYDPATETWRTTGAPEFHSSMVYMERLSNGKVLAVSRQFAKLYDPDTEQWGNTGNLNVIRWDPQTITLLQNGKVLVTGLVDFNPGARRAEIYDPNTGTWSTTSSTGTDTERRNFENPTTTLLPDGRVLLAGGYATSEPPGEEIYDPATGTWSYTSRLTFSRHNYHTATLLQNGTVMVTGGADEGADQYTPAWSATELYALDPAAILKPKITAASISRKHLFVAGVNFDAGAAIFINSVEQRTKNFDERPQNILIGKNAGKKLKAGDKLQVRNSNGLFSEEFIFTGS